MVDFARWDMPVMYRGIIEEHVHTRTACSLFDVSHMGRLKISGPDAEALLQLVCTRDLAGMPPGASRYSHVCREDGGILDDVIVARFDDHFGMVCNASNRDKIIAWLNQHAAGRSVTLEDQTFKTAMIAVQGPQAISQIELLLGITVSDLKRYHFRKQVFMTFPCTVYRSGYTGEDGVEIVLPVNLVKLAMPALLGLGHRDDPVIKPAGLGARDTLRLEAAMPLYGHELSEDWDSLTAGQAWCVHLDKKDFVGADAMRRIRDQGLSRRVVGLELDGRRTARQGYAVHVGGRPVGQVTSGALSPTLNKSIAMALVAQENTADGSRLAVEFPGGKFVDATVVGLPFYKRPK